MNLFYEQTDAGIGNTANYTGMLSGVKWKANTPSGGNSDERSYIFAYDKLYRLTSATYKAKTGSSWTKDVNGFNEAVTYEWNGNITSMQRNSVISGSVTAIDNLTYDYGSNNDNNQLLNMTESSSNSYGYRNFTSSSSGYSYDENGNLTADAKKGTTLTYNELNKVLKITQTASPNKYVEYGYDAAGIKISKKVYDGSTTKTINYIGAFEFDENNALTHFAMPEGRVRKSGSSTYTFEYFITDHQGNVRVSFEDNSGTAIVRQENSYYPYGMIMAGNYQPSAPNKRLYNAGSQWQDEFSGTIDYFSTFYREYDPVLGRFNSVDPMSEATVDLSIYHYSNNNPINFNDPMGDVAEGNIVRLWLDEIIDILRSAPNGASWSASNGFTVFQNETEALAITTLTIMGFDFSSGSGSGSSSQDIKEKYVKRFKEILYDKKRDFRFVSGTLDVNNQVYKELVKIAEKAIGSALLAFLDVASEATGAKLVITTSDGFSFAAQLDPGHTSTNIDKETKILLSISVTFLKSTQIIDGVLYMPHRTLAHELFHAADIYGYTKIGNLVIAFNPNGHETAGESTRLFGNPHRIYMEIRAVAFDNHFALVTTGTEPAYGSKMPRNKRVNYGQINLYYYVDKVFSEWSFPR